MTMSRNAVGNLITRYKSVLQNCSLLNTFGTLALAGVMVLGGTSGALAGDVAGLSETVDGNSKTVVISDEFSTTTDYYAGGDPAQSFDTVDMTMNGGAFAKYKYLYGGGKLTSAGEVTIASSNITINDGSCWYIYAGPYVASKDATGIIKESTITINDGSFNYDIYLGANTTIADSSLTGHVEISRLIINGGTFDNDINIYAYGKATGQGMTSTNTVGTAILTFTGNQTEAAAKGYDASDDFTSLAEGYAGIDISAAGSSYSGAQGPRECIIEFGTTGENGVAYTGAFNADLDCVNHVTVNEGSDVIMTLPTFNWFANHYKDGAGTLHIAGEGFSFGNASFSILEGMLDIENGWNFGGEGCQGVDALVVASGASLKIGGELKLAETYWDQKIRIGGTLEAGSVTQLVNGEKINNATITVEKGGKFITESFIASAEMALNVKVGGTANIDALTLTNGFAQTINTGQLVITGDIKTSFGDADNGVLTVGTLHLVDDATITLYDKEYTEDDVTTTQKVIADVANGSDEFTVNFIGTLVDDSGVAEELKGKVDGGEIKAVADSSFKDDGTTCATGNRLSIDATGVNNSSTSLTSTDAGLGTMKDVAIHSVAEDIESIGVTVKGNSTLVGDGTGALLSATSDSGGTVTTSITVTDNSTLNVGISDSLNAQGGSLESVTVGDSSDTEKSATLNINTASATIGSLTATGTAQINVLNSSVVAEKFTSDAGSVLYIDPAYVQIANATAKFDGTVLVSDGSALVLGDDDTTRWQELVESTGLTSTSLDTGFTVGVGYSAIILSGSAIDMGTTGKLVVDSGVNSAGKISGSTALYKKSGAYFGDDSLCIIDMKKWSDSEAALSVQTLETVSGAKLLVTTSGATLGADANVATIKIADVTTNKMVSGAWGYDSDDTVDTDTIFLDNAFMEVTAVIKNDTSYSVTVGQVDASDALGSNMDSGLATLINSGVASGVDSAGIEFIKAASTADSGDRGAIVEGATKLAINSAVVPGLSNVNTAATTNMGTRTSIVPQAKVTAASETSTWLAMDGDGAILPAADGGNMAQGFGIWFMPMYNQTSADGFSSGNYDYGYDTNIVGATLGADYTFASDLRLGLAFNVGSGSSTSTGDFASTDNDFDFFGLSAYGAKHFDQFGLSFDMGYTVSQNEMVQDQAGGDLSGDVDAALFTVGLKAEYQIPLDSFNMTPYAGLRFNYYDVDAYDTMKAGASLFSTDSSDSTVWEIPVGVTFDTTTKVGSWDMTPSLGLGVKFAMGDLDAEQEVSITDVPGSSILSSEVVDEVTFQGALGLGFAKDNCTIGFNYNLDLSENVESHGLSVNLRYDF